MSGLSWEESSKKLLLCCSLAPRPSNRMPARILRSRRPHQQQGPSHPPCFDCFSQSWSLYRNYTEPLCFIRVIYEANCPAAQSQRSPQTVERVVKVTKLHFYRCFSQLQAMIRHGCVLQRSQVPAYILEMMLRFMFYLVMMRQRHSSQVEPPNQQ